MFPGIGKGDSAARMPEANDCREGEYTIRKGGRICAEIFCDTDKQGSVRAYVTEVNRTLPMYKRMTRMEFRDEPFPKTATGKIQRV